MALTDGQYKVRDLVMGPGTAYCVATETNPFVRNVRADQGGPRAWNHGNWSGAEWMDQVVIPLRIVIETTACTGTPAQRMATWLPLHQALQQAFRPIADAIEDVEFRFAYAGTEYLMYGRPRMVEPNIATVAKGVAVTKAAFVALDPLIYSGAETCVTGIGQVTFTGGLTVPITAPFTIGATQTGGQAVLTNAGTADAGLTLRLDGPLTQPFVSLLRPDATTQTLRFNFDIAAGQWLDVDTAERTVLLNGTDSRRGQTSGDFPLLPPGTSTLRFRTASEADTGTLKVCYRSAWW